MNILMIHPHDICSDSEPWTVRIVYIANEFVKNNHKVALVYFKLPEHRPLPPILDKRIITIGLSRKPGIHNLIVNICKVYKAAKDSDIIHFQKCFYHAALPAIAASFLRGKPIHYDWDDWEQRIYEVSTQPCLLRDVIRFFLNILENTIPRIADTVSVASARLKVECEKRGVNRKRIFDAHVGADITRFHPGVSGEAVKRKYHLKNPVVLYLGQLHGGQYVELFIQAADKLINEYRKDVSFMIVGDGYRADELKRMALELNLNGKLIFAGAVSHDLVPQYIAAADVCVACFQENDVTLCKSPLKIVEYMAVGKAIVASNVGEVSTMIKDAGILTDPGDALSLAKAIMSVLQNEALKERLERSARARAEDKYNWAVTAKNILEAYKEAIGKN